MPPPHFTCRRGTTYLGPINHPSVKNRHLFIVITDRSQDGEVVAVNISTVRNNVHKEDLVCLLHPGDHSFIQHPSYVYYRGARIEQTSVVEGNFHRGIIKPMENLGDDVLRRVCAGLLESPVTPLKIKEFYKTHHHPTGIQK